MCVWLAHLSGPRLLFSNGFARFTFIYVFYVLLFDWRIWVVPCRCSNGFAHVMFVCDWCIWVPPLVCFFSNWCANFTLFNYFICFVWLSYLSGPMSCANWCARFTFMYLFYCVCLTGVFEWPPFAFLMDLHVSLVLLLFDWRILSGPLSCFLMDLHVSHLFICLCVLCLTCVFGWFPCCLIMDLHVSRSFIYFMCVSDWRIWVVPWCFLMDLQVPI